MVYSAAKPKAPIVHVIAPVPNYDDENLSPHVSAPVPNYNDENLSPHVPALVPNYGGKNLSPHIPAPVPIYSDETLSLHIPQSPSESLSYPGMHHHIHDADCPMANLPVLDIKSDSE